MTENKGPEGIKDILSAKKPGVKPPAYEWQDLALRIIKELNVPGFKKSSVFKVCKEKSKIFIEGCLSDTKDLCKTGEKWKYFFKLTVDEKNNKT